MAKIEYKHKIKKKVIILKEGKLFNGEINGIKIDISLTNDEPPEIKENIIYVIKHKFSATNTNTAYNNRSEEGVFENAEEALKFIGATII
jgi:hypothetical protein